ncbi:hypothetical protein [Rhodococcus sp. MTM3W5.2]|uniref:hypothetical protein n=1 Tax=Rhodococcus sp. MTM3W5.2 TaxID=1805827 RepID=UPI001CB8E0DF|nr:hypothetical protein [Rhodococcus sp. MTM3W5.2]
MAHLLMVESWVGAMGTLLPRAVTDAGATFTFLTRDPGHYPQTTPTELPTRCAGDARSSPRTRTTPSPPWMRRAVSTPNRASMAS